MLPPNVPPSYPPPPPQRYYYAALLQDHLCCKCTARHLSAGYPSRLWRLRKLRRHAKVWRARQAEEGLHTEGRQRQQGCCAGWLRLMTACDHARRIPELASSASSPIGPPRRRVHALTSERPPRLAPAPPAGSHASHTQHPRPPRRRANAQCKALARVVMNRCPRRSVARAQYASH